MSEAFQAKGFVTFVGAGPGDPQLLTLKAVKAIAAATVILVDDLVSPAVLAHKHEAARVIHVGKRGGAASTPQAFIDECMVHEAKRGERVVRLKGGDPLIFGRLMQEVEALEAAGVGFAIVNGVSAGLAAAATLGVSLTDRERAHGVLWMTGHPHAGSPPTNWPLVSQMAQQLGLTIVIYMGVAQASLIASGLLACGLTLTNASQGGGGVGLPAHTPVAVVHRASTEREQVLLTTLGRMCVDLQTMPLKSPAVIVIGEVVRQSEKLQALMQRIT